jgi:MFS family permease
MGRSGLTLGALLALMAGMNFLGSGIAGWLADRAGDRPITFMGTILTAIGLVFLGTAGNNPEMSRIVMSTAVLGLGFGIHQAAVYALTLRGTPREYAGSTSAALTVSQTIGSVMSIALMTSILNWRQATQNAIFADAYQFSYLTAAGIALVSGMIVLRLRLKAQ